MSWVLPRIPITFPWSSNKGKTDWLSHFTFLLEKVALWLISKGCLSIINCAVFSWNKFLSSAEKLFKYSWNKSWFSFFSISKMAYNSLDQSISWVLKLYSQVPIFAFFWAKFKRFSLRINFSWMLLISETSRPRANMFPSEILFAVHWMVTNSPLLFKNLFL